MIRGRLPGLHELGETIEGVVHAYMTCRGPWASRLTSPGLPPFPTCSDLQWVQRSLEMTGTIGLIRESCLLSHACKQSLILVQPHVSYVYSALQGAEQWSLSCTCILLEQPFCSRMRYSLHL